MFKSIADDATTSIVMQAEKDRHLHNRFLKAMVFAYEAIMFGGVWQ